MIQVILKSGKAKPFWHREPLVFSGAIQSVQGDPSPAEWVSVYDAHHEYVGSGVFNPYSLYRVRLLSFASEQLEEDVLSVVRLRLTQAIEKRRKMNLPNHETNAYRLLNSEADGVSGLTVDIFDQTAVVSSTAYWTESYREQIQNILLQLFAVVRWRQQVKSLTQDGWRERDIFEKRLEIVLIQEHGLSYQVDIGFGQKTGFYCDQRENRYQLRSWIQDRQVLDCFCYTGGFALNAAKGGARTVLGIDSSEQALVLAKKNAQLNGFTQVTFEEHDVENFLEKASEKAREFDCIILDPPKLAPREKDVPCAQHFYEKLNMLALKNLPTGGLLVTFSCSDAIHASLFLAMVRSAAKKAGKVIKIWTTLQAGSDHPCLEKSQYGHYLKGLVLEVKG